ncbi:MAG: hypothetical protein ACJ75H_17465 [Thermoanaerobaculia bacterium]
MSLGRNLRAATVAVFTLLMSVPLWGKSEDEDLSKKTCNPPEFSFTWLGYDLVRLTATADPEQTFAVTLQYLEEPTKGWEKKDAFRPIRLNPGIAPNSEPDCSSIEQGDGLEEGVTFCIPATPKGSTASIFMDRKALLHAGGFASLKYQALDNDRAEACEERKQGPSDPIVKVLDKHTLNFDVGSVFNFQGDGSWETNAEVAMVASSQWTHWFQSGYSLRYSAIGGGEEEPPADTNDKTDDDDSSEVFNPFSAGGGVLETNIYILGSPIPRLLPRLGIVLGWGLSSFPGEADSQLQMRQRAFIGIRNTIQAFNAGRIGDSLENSSGYIQAGLATDELWKRTEVDPGIVRNESNRFFFNGQIELPKIGNEWFRVDLRFFASVPRSGDGPSDVRISALGSIDPRRWFPDVGKPQ